MEGKITSRHRCHLVRRIVTIISRKSFGIELAPAITLKRMYHWAPSIIKRIAPMLRDRPMSMKISVAKGKSRIAGKLASTWTTGWAKRESFGLMPIFTPIGTQMMVEMTRSTTTRPKVANA